MKIRILAIALLVVMSMSLLLTSCQDPLEAKAKEMNKAYAAMSDAFYRANYLACLAGKVGNKDDSLNDQAITMKLNKWKPDIKDAKDVVADWLNMSGEDMDDYIEEWNEITEEIYDFCSQYDGVESYLDD